MSDITWHQIEAGMLRLGSTGISISFSAGSSTPFLVCHDGCLVACGTLLADAKARAELLAAELREMGLLR